MALLKSWGYKEIPCISKTLMCGDIGIGGMAEVDTIISTTLRSLNFHNRETIRDTNRETLRETIREPIREPIRDTMRDTIRDTNRETIRETWDPYMQSDYRRQENYIKTKKF